jgi:hypothetical protein
MGYCIEEGLSLTAKTSLVLRNCGIPDFCALFVQHFYMRAHTVW